MTFKSYIAARRYKGGITKFLYDQVKSLDTGIGKKAEVWVSTEQTADGTEQSITHTLGAIPSKVVVIPTLVDKDAGVSITEGTHTKTLIKVTVTDDAKFKIIAFK